ncbi:MAG: OmpP1/FadL family transporter [Bradymonadia bacterium]
MNRRKLIAALSLTGALASADALASGILVARFGGEHGHPTTDNPTAMYYNPAGLALKQGGFRLYIDGSLAWRSFTYDRPAEAIDYVFTGDEPQGTVNGTPPELVGANSGEASLFNVLGAPFIGVASDFGIKNFGAGLSFYAPFGGQSVYDKSDFTPGAPYDGFPGLQDGSQRWWTIEGTIRSLYFTGAAAYRLPDYGLSFGVGVNLVKNEVKTVRARLGSGEDHLVTRTIGANGDITDERLEGRADVDLSSWELALGLGVIWEPGGGHFLGFSYQSQPGFGQNSVEGKSRKYLAGGPTQEEDATLEQSYPDVFRLGWRLRDGMNEYRLFGDYARWSVFDRQCIFNTNGNSDNCNLAELPRDWDDGFGVRGGYSRFLDDTTEIYVGAGFDSTAAPDSTVEPALFDANKISGSLGARFMLNKNEETKQADLVLAATYTQLYYFTRDIDPRPNGDGQSDVSGTPFAGSTTRRNPDSAGEYNQAVGVLNLNMEYIF